MCLRGCRYRHGRGRGCGLGDVDVDVNMEVDVDGCVGGSVSGGWTPVAPIQGRTEPLGSLRVVAGYRMHTFGHQFFERNWSGSDARKGLAGRHDRAWTEMIHARECSWIGRCTSGNIGWILNIFNDC